LFVQRDWSDTEADRAAYLDMIASLGYLAPDPLYEMLRTLRLREVDATQPGRRAKEEKIVRAGLGAFPELAGVVDVDAVARANTDFLLARGVDWVYLTACKAVPGLLDEVVSYQGCELLERAMAVGPVILAPFHFGPSEFLVGGIARRVAPVTVVVSDQDRRPARGGRRVMRSATMADIESVQNGTVGVLLGCLRALRGGRAVMMFPELSFSDTPERRIAVPFCGRTIYVPQGIAMLAAKSKAAVLPCHVERAGPGYYRCVVGEPLPPGPNLTTDLFAYCERLIRGGLAAEWEFWLYMLRRLLFLPPGWPRPVPPNSPLIP
jgi:lauroyl/myristoyl acyltransferase